MIALLITVLLLLLNAFFVGAEFAAMASRRSQLEPLAQQGSRRAKQCLEAIEQLGSVLAMGQLGITVCSVLLGAYSEAALHHYLVPVMELFGLPVALAEGFAVATALLIVVYFHVVVGEMIPKNLSLAVPNQAALILVPPLLWLTKVLRFIIRVLETAAKFVVRRFGVEPKDEVATEYTAQEVAHILDESRRVGLVPTTEAARLGAAIEFSDKDAAQVAVPVKDLVTITPTTTPTDIEALVAKRGFSRYLVADDDGMPVGYVHLKDVLYADDERQRHQPLQARRIRRLANVSPHDGVHAIVESMRGTGSHLARVVQPNGQIIGVVFLEDVLEELVGTVKDSTQR